MQSSIRHRFDGSIRFVFTGSSRIVLLVGCYALKLPRFTEWRLFLRGLLANMQEAMFGRSGMAGFCPVLFALPGGFLVVMPRCEPLEYEIDYAAFCDRGDYRIPAEYKSESFGLLDGEVVAIDYGN